MMARHLLSTATMRFLLALGLSGVAALGVAACSSSDDGSVTPAVVGPDADSGGGGAVAPQGAVTFHKDVEPILQKVCQNCHVSGGIAPFSLVTYADAKAVAASVVYDTGAKVMPPWGAQNTAECTPPKAWKDDLRLSDAEIATIKAWHDGGDFEGDPADAQPARTTPPITNLTGATQLTPATTFTATGDTDTFKCFVLDPGLTATKYLTGTNFVPKNKTVVHHALAYAIPAGTKTSGDVYDCFGGPGVAGADLVAAWAPGGVPNEYPADVGLALAAGTKFIMQVHYHPHANASLDPDATTFEFRVTDAVPTYKAVTRLVGNFQNPVAAAGIGLEPGMDDTNGKAEFLIPADAPAHVETMDFKMPALGGTSPVWILGVGAHMHLAGHDEKISLTHAGAESCLMQEPAWNFNWQRGYQYDAPIEQLPTIEPGDMLKIRCTYDNTMQNLPLATARKEAGITTSMPITLGESTTDEMCLGALTFVTK